MTTDHRLSEGRRGLLFAKEIHAAVFLLLAVLVHNLTYPLSGAGGVWPALFYAFFGSIFVVAVFATTPDRSARLSIAVTGLAVFASGILNSYAPTQTMTLALYLSVIAYHGIVLIVLSRYLFGAADIFTPVVVTATSLYLIIGSVFTALFGLVEWLAPGSFVQSSGAAVEWQQFLYFSYVTLTSLGYGDILPVGFYAQSLAAFEAVVGVLYTVILLSRLVGMHQSARA